MKIAKTFPSNCCSLPYRNFPFTQNRMPHHQIEFCATCSQTLTSIHLLLVMIKFGFGAAQRAQQLYVYIFDTQRSNVRQLRMFNLQLNLITLVYTMPSIRMWLGVRVLMCIQCMYINIHFLYLKVPYTIFTRLERLPSITCCYTYTIKCILYY